jgi:truncated hemoglobin YjbI
MRQLFYRRLFEIDPSLKQMFKGDMAGQRRKLMQMLTAAVKAKDAIGERPSRQARRWAAKSAAD